MSSLRYLVAGGAGFIGSHLVDKLLDNNAEVVIIDNFSSGSEKNLEHLSNDSRVKIYNQDVTKNLPDCYDFDAVFHLASIANPTDYEKRPLEALFVNSVGNQNLLNIAKRSNVRYYFFSSSEIYGHHNPIPKDGLQEESKAHLVLGQKRSPYYVGKIYGEELVSNLCMKYGLEYLIVRPFNIYGTRMDLNTSYGRVIPNFIRWALAGQSLAINGDGTQERSFCYIDDFIDCIMKTLNKVTIDYNIINIGNPEPIKIISLAQKINGIIGNKSGYLFREGYKYEPKYRTPNIDLARKWLDWEPKVKLEDGIRAIIERKQCLKMSNSEFESVSCCSHVLPL